MFLIRFTQYSNASENKLDAAQIGGGPLNKIFCLVGTAFDQMSP